ncbi:MAG TPA: hemerythrin domain-containing protein [Caulobacterales bacterium]|nr:hemerythrin domain-containing protein [Caulobacterales bacterium]
MSENDAAGGARTGRENDQNQSGNGKGVQAKGEDAIATLKNDHRKVEQLFQQFQQSGRRSEKQKLARQICQELIVHTMLEEEIFYPACREHVDDAMLDEAQVEHDGAKVLITEILSGAPDQPFYDAKVKVLSEEIKHHVNEEEKRDGIFAKAKASGLDAEALGKELAERKTEILEDIEANGLERPRPRSFRAGMDRRAPQPSLEERRLTSRRGDAQDRERDSHGRFMGDDERRFSSARPARYEDDERGASGRGREERERPGEGRYRDEDDRRRAARRREDDDDRGSRGRGHGGWFGDPEGHSEAARRGWEDR